MKKQISLLLLLFIIACSPEKTKPKKITTSPERTDSPTTTSLEMSIKKLLAQFSTKLPNKPYRVSVGNFTLRDSEISSSFGLYVFDETSTAINKTEFLEEFPRNQLDVILNEQKISISDLFEPDTVALTGNLKGIQGIINGNYQILGDQIKLYVQLLDVETGKTLGKDSVIIHAKSISGNLDLYPSNYKQSVKVLSGFAMAKQSDFTIKTWVDKSNGAVYKVGDTLTVYFTSNVDCYLKLYHIDVNGNINVIFPNEFKQNNKIKANVVYKIPDVEDEFEFTMKPPLGSEIIKAVASTTPFVKDKSPNLGNARSSSQEKLSQILHTSIKGRGLEITGTKKTKKAEASCVYTIVE